MLTAYHVSFTTPQAEWNQKIERLSRALELKGFDSVAEEQIALNAIQEVAHVGSEIDVRCPQCC